MLVYWLVCTAVIKYDKGTNLEAIDIFNIVLKAGKSESRYSQDQYPTRAVSTSNMVLCYCVLQRELASCSPMATNLLGG